MFKKFIYLEWKSFLRSASFGTNLAIKIVMGLFALYFIGCFIVMGFAIYPILEDVGLNPLQTVNKYLIYYLVGDLLIRYLIQKMPVVNIRPLLILPIKRNVIVHFTMGKTILSFFNFLHAFFFIPFSIMMVIKGLPVANVLLWHLGVLALIYSNNFINILANNKNAILFPLGIIVGGFAVAQFYDWFDITLYTSLFFQGLFDTYYMSLLLLFVAIAWYYFAFNYFKNNLNLDEALQAKSETATTENLTFLNQFGSLGTFLKNDIKLIKRNKRSKSTLMASFLFLFYGLIFFTNSSQPEIMKIFAGIFVSGGFLFTFGQFVPSWDSSYYPLMMSQNITYRDYLNSKWWLVVIATIISTILGSFYLYFGWQTYLFILVGAIYNIGVNSHLVLFGGAFVKTPIDLASSKGAFGNKQGFNVKIMLLSIPKLLLPLALYGFGKYFFNANTGLLFVAIAGILGFSLRNLVFKKIEKIYKSEKYATILAYKQV
jgi:hypothetical protein